ncbi:Siderophore synthetase component [Kushneria avicenniae]|uniref:Siderophore synthetase component n=1 Tax=Kushneria avicenniae TaxID=402385 RepID=A0A1I1LRC7_9GAMM|nr:GNAT family N-acetyltransferase [Kushneria avicenniae]SFC73488.1 Siderophore synthetase component [Kushneria avicenniae]
MNSFSTSLFHAGQRRMSATRSGHTGAFEARFHRDWSGIGTLSLRPLDLEQDLDTVHAWVSQPDARFWGMTDDSRDRVGRFYRDMEESTAAQAWLGLHDGQPAFLVECYDPRHDPVGEQYTVQPGDRGMHFLVAPLGTTSDTPIHGFSQAVIDTIVAFLFSDPSTQRIVVEPDVANARIHPLNRRAGFVYDREIQIGDKTAHLAFHTRTDFEATDRRHQRMSADQACGHLEPGRWARANRDLLIKAIAELAHERLLIPEQAVAPDAAGWGEYRLETTSVQYRFRARRLALDQWWIDKTSLEKIAQDTNGAAAELKPLSVEAFLLEFRERLGIDPDNLPTYLEEIASTLAGMAYKLGRDLPEAETLALADFQTLEAAMSEGHPCFIANSGRIGFDAQDYHRYAPEAGALVRPLWLGVARACTDYSAIDGLDIETLLCEELDDATRDRFTARLEALALDPADYYFMPVHPWQWRHKLAITFAGEVAQQRIVLLGEGDDDYQPQQSIRTWFNASRPQRRYVKFALSILNMGFMRGLSPHYMHGTPAINSWVQGVIHNDPELQARGFGMLREVATLGYHHAGFEAACDKHSPYQKMLACLWRESPCEQVADHQRLMTMAALLHRDAEDRPLLPALIKASGLDAATWIDRYLAAYMTPLLHCFYAHDLVFMPHGENLILKLEDHVPVGAILKDIGEETAIFDNGQSLPETARRIAVAVPEHLRILSIFTDLFDCFFRFLAQILVETNTLEAQTFWERVGACVVDYQRRHPELAEKFARYDLFAPTFTLSCLNRLQLRNNRQMIDLADPAGNLQFAGELINPIAGYRPQDQKRPGCLTSTSGVTDTAGMTGEP